MQALSITACIAGRQASMAPACCALKRHALLAGPLRRLTITQRQDELQCSLSYQRGGRCRGGLRMDRLLKRVRRIEAN